MCDYSHEYTYPAVKDMPETTERVYCKRAAQFWVQSLLSTHNMHACAQHLARIIRDIEECAQQFDIMTRDLDALEPAEHWFRKDHNGKRLTPATTTLHSNYARVTVKPYTRKGTHNA